MLKRWGKNPEYTISVCSNFNWYSGELALPIKLAWWYSSDMRDNKNYDIAITFLCFRFGLEIWRWKNAKN